MKAFQGSKAKIVRRFGINIFETDKYDKILNRRKFPPGMHGPTKRVTKISEYATFFFIFSPLSSIPKKTT